jgi:hypothetical protein
MNQEMFEKVRALVAECRPMETGKLSEQTDLHKLGMDGDDAREFLKAFSVRFSVDMSEFEFNRYFGSEGFNPISYIYFLLFARDKLRKMPITLGHLAEAAQNKKWVKR